MAAGKQPLLGQVWAGAGAYVRGDRTRAARVGGRGGCGLGVTSAGRGAIFLASPGSQV